MAATMPDPEPALRIADPLDGGRGQTPAQRADGPSACPGDSSHERRRVGASDDPWDMQQAAKSTRVRNAGEDLLPRPGSASTILRRSGWATAACAAKAAGGHARMTTHAGAAGRGETLCRSARPDGEARNKTTGEPWGRTEHGAMARVLAVSTRGSAMPGVCPQRRSRGCLTTESVANDGRCQSARLTGRTVAVCRKDRAPHN